VPSGESCHRRGQGCVALGRGRCQWSPNLNIPLFIVAPEERRGKVREEISRPTFSRALRKPLARSCRYISFSRLREDAARLGTYVRVVKPEEFVEALSESFDNGA